MATYNTSSPFTDLDGSCEIVGDVAPATAVLSWAQVL